MVFSGTFMSLNKINSVVESNITSDATYYINDFNNELKTNLADGGTNIGNSGTLGFGVKNFTLLFWFKPRFSDIISTSYNVATFLGGGGPSNGRSTNSFHIFIHYKDNTGTNQLRFDVNYWGIGGIQYFIDAPAEDKWVFVCFQGYINGSNHTLDCYSYTLEDTLNENNIQSVTNYSGSKTNWASSFNSSVASTYSIILGQFQQPFTNYSYITSINNNYNKYTKHFGIFNSKISYSDIVSYFNATKNDLTIS